MEHTFLRISPHNFTLLHGADKELFNFLVFYPIFIYIIFRSVFLSEPKWLRKLGIQKES